MSDWAAMRPIAPKPDRSRSAIRCACLVAALVAALPALGWTATPVRVATWNVEAVGSPGSVEYDATLAVLERIGADVVGINEVSSTADTANFEQLALDAGYPYTAFPSGGPFGSLRNAFLSRFPFAVAPEIHTSQSLSGDASANDITRRIVELTIDVPGATQDLVLVIQHWKSGTGNDDEFRRAVESYRIAQSLEGLDSSVDAFVVFGDVNEEADSTPRTPNPFSALPSGLPGSFSLGTDLQLLLAGSGIENDPFFYLVDAAGPAAELVPALQLDGSDATRPASGRRLDYVLVSSSLAPLAVAEVYDSADEGLPGGLLKFATAPAASTSTDASDHYLVFADLVLPSPVVVLPALTGWNSGLLFVLLLAAARRVLAARA